MKTRSPLGILTAFVVLAFLFATPAPSGAVVSGTNGRIAFVSDRSGTKQIYAMRADGTFPIQLTSVGNNWDPAFGPDGTKIAFVTDRDGTVELYTMNADGSGQTRITHNSMIESHPTWSPAGGQITFAALVGSDSDIWRVNAVGGGLKDLTPDPVAFDADPAWSPGGIKIAFDSTNRSGNTGTDIYTMNNDGTLITRLTTTGKDTNPSYAPDNKNLTFESTRDNGTPGPQLFATLSKPPIGVAVTSTKVLVTQFNSDKVQQIDSSGVPSNFATLPANGTSIERYIAISPGVGAFPKDYVYVTVGPNVYQITPDGITVTLCANIPSLPNGETGITFDTVGTFGNKMILTDRTGPVWTVDSCAAPNATMIGDVGAQIEGPLVAPTSFVPYGGQLLLGNEFQNNVYAMSNTGVVSTVITAESPEGLVLIPPTVCNMGTSGGAYFVAMKDMKQVFKFDASNFTGLNDDILAPSELVTDINRLHSNGSSISSSQFSGAIGTPDLEASAFAPCGAQSTPGGAGPATSAQPREIYKMTDTGGSQTRLTTNTTDDINPFFSPDGLKIVFQADRDDPSQPGCEDTRTCKYEIYSMNASDGSGQTNLTSNTSANDVTPDWEAVSFPVSVTDFVFTPGTANPKFGGSVLWEFYGPSQHTATDNSGMQLFDSGTKDSGGFFVFRFFAAGNYPIICTLHPTQMTGTVKAPMTAAPKTGNLSTVFTIIWAAIKPPAGFQYDVQILRPGAPDWVDWKADTGKTGAGFTADGGTGIYSFRARIQKTVDQTASDYSAPVSITVNP